MNEFNILVVDDDSAIRELFKRFLGKYGYFVDTASDGLEAIDRMKSRDYDMLIVDLKMPKMSGMALINKAKEIKKELLVIVITGYATISTAKEAIKKGCYDYITKPFDIENVNIVIKRAFEMHKLQGEKKRLKEHVLVAERLASLAQMGAGVAHEVNTVLTSIKLYLEVLKKKTHLKGDIKNVNLMLEEVERVEKLIHRFFSFTKQSDVEFSKTNLNIILQRACNFFKYKFKKYNIKVIKLLDKSISCVFCDVAGIEEVFLNILTNSIEAMDGGGTITIKSRQIDKQVIIEFRDTGYGISQEDKTKLYNPFFTTKKQGTGLGLAIVYKIVNKNKGVIKIENCKDKGTIIILEFPVAKEQLAKR